MKTQRAIPLDWFISLLPMPLPLSLSLYVYVFVCMLEVRSSFNYGVSFRWNWQIGRLIFYRSWWSWYHLWKEVDLYRISWHDSCIALLSSPRHSYRILPYIISQSSDIISHSIRSCDMMWKGAIRCTERCDTIVCDSIRARYKNHARMFYLSLNFSIAVLA